MGMIFARTPPTLPLEGGGCSRGGVTRGGPPGMLNSMSDIVAVLPATLLAPGESRRERPRSAMACSRAAAELPRVDVGEVGRSPIPTPKAEPAARARYPGPLPRVPPRPPKPLRPAWLPWLELLRLKPASAASARLEPGERSVPTGVPSSEATVSSSMRYVSFSCSAAARSERSCSSASLSSLSCAYSLPISRRAPPPPTSPPSPSRAGAVPSRSRGREKTSRAALASLRPEPWSLRWGCDENSSSSTTLVEEVIPIS